MSVQETVQEFWRNKARGLLLGQAAADAVASGGDGVVMRYGASTALALVVGEYVGLHGTVGPDDIRPLATAMAHTWWTSRDREGWGPRDAHRFGAVLDGDVYPVPTEFEPSSDGVLAAAVVAPLALMAVGSEVHGLARRCAAVLSMDAEERSAAAVLASAAALALSGELHRPLDADRFVERLQEGAGSGLVEDLALVQQLARGASPADVAAVFAFGRIVGESNSSAAVCTALLAFLLHHDDPVACVRFAVDVGGDFTVTAAMAGALSGGRCGGTALPLMWIDRLERVEQVRGLADRIASRYRAPLVS